MSPTELMLREEMATEELLLTRFTSPEADQLFPTAFVGTSTDLDTAIANCRQLVTQSPDDFMTHIEIERILPACLESDRSGPLYELVMDLPCNPMTFNTIYRLFDDLDAPRLANHIYTREPRPGDPELDSEEYQAVGAYLRELELARIKAEMERLESQDEPKPAVFVMRRVVRAIEVDIAA